MCISVPLNSCKISIRKQNKIARDTKEIVDAVKKTTWTVKTSSIIGDSTVVDHIIHLIILLANSVNTKCPPSK